MPTKRSQFSYGSTGQQSHCDSYYYQMNNPTVSSPDNAQHINSLFVHQIKPNISSHFDLNSQLSSERNILYTIIS